MSTLVVIDVLNQAVSEKNIVSSKIKLYMNVIDIAWNVRLGSLVFTEVFTQLE